MDRAFDAVKRLVTDFKAQESAYLAPGYQESQVRQDFIDKFFTALGWDVTHEKQKNPYEQEVHIENKVKMAGSSQRRADYAFFLNPNFRDPKFFVEAKKPSRNLANRDDYYQAIRYAWNAKTPLAVLTDFEEFHILDCRFKPDINDALNRKVASFHYADYADADTFAYINYLFSREAVAAGSIEKRAAELPKPRGKGGQKGASRGAYQAVDEAFLEELDAYRSTLAKAFKKADDKLDGEELTEAVQRTIDRLVFIRFLEDKGIEEKGIIGIKGQKSARKAFVNICKKYEPKYNGLVFKPHRILDEITFGPAEEKTFAGICAELADPASPYDFNQIPISILGSIYERFLGKVVHATDKRVKVEEKPEVRKAGGVYYTPEYIVRYIVKETVGKLIEGKTPAEIAPMAFADIACGSGSFLIEVYAQLLDYHVRYYEANREKAKPDEVFERDGHLQLTLKKKKEILLNNIYGVDIDFQATEVTQLSLYLKLLEDATMSDAHQFGLFKETILPDLKQNIVCGNSLIGRDIAEGSLFSNVDEAKLKPMNFNEVFRKVMKRGGFDAIVGNPPYIKIQAITENDPITVHYLKSHYESAKSGNYDIYVAFVEKAAATSKSGALVGYILPYKFFNSGYGVGLRDFLWKNKLVSRAIHFGDHQVFEGATTYTCLLFLMKDYHESIEVAKLQGDEAPERFLLNPQFEKIAIGKWSEQDWLIQDLKSENIFGRLSALPRLGDLTTNIFQGPKAGADNVFILKLLTRGTGKCRCYSESLDREVDLEAGILRTYVKGKFIRRYNIHREANEVTIFPYDSNATLLSAEHMAKEFPLTWQYLNDSANKKILNQREEGRFGKNWWCYSRPQNMKILWHRKILTPFNAFKCSFGLDDRGDFVFSAGVSGAYGIVLKHEAKASYEFLLAILNSSLTFFVIKNISTALRGNFWSFENKYLLKLPIRTVDLEDPRDKQAHDQIVKLANEMLQSKEKLAGAKTDAEKNRLELQCESLDRQIDEAVYELYGLTEEEIKIVEGKE
ncbi:MAG: Eco57I restriction-modification methylase domain-containing protein [Ignavibacteriales bacterium]|nr:Eco57I restriction-modification methylase domain-containing protein [Ignavibacteriales bacterium]